MTRNRNYRRLWLAAAISNLGDGVALTALPLLAVTLTRDPILVAGVDAAGRLPWLLFSLLSGALVDRADRRSMMAGVDLARAFIVGLIGLAAFGGWMTLPLLYVLVFLLGVAETLFDNASQAIMPMVVSRRSLEKANARLYAAQIVTNEFVGPPLGSLLFAVAVAAPFGLDAASFVLAAFLAWTMRGSFHPHAGSVRPGTTLRAEIKEGLVWLWQQRLLRTMAISLGIFNFLWHATTSVLVLFALEILRLPAARFGVLLAAGAAGSLLASAFASRVSARLGGGRALTLVALVSAGVLVGIGLTSSPWVAGVMLALGAGSGVIWNVVTVSLRQSAIPDHLLGRVNSAYRLIGWGAIPIGAVTGGFIARTLGLRAPFLIASAALAVTALSIIRSMEPGIRALQRDAALRQD